MRIDASPGSSATHGAEINLAKMTLSRILRLPDFVRFVFILKDLEGYLVSDCAQLLKCSLDTVRLAGLVAEERLRS